MQLWTDYEGLTIDGTFPLKKLLKPEGRSAFFSTSGTDGELTVVRLIECHFDEEEILSRWRCVDALHHPNFLRFERFGQTELDGRPVVYAVFEKVDGNLAEVLDQGVLTLPDTAQLASSLLAALEVLHTHGYVHEHIEPSNIFAIGDNVKLRGDCIREAPEGDEGRIAKQRDVHDLATVLLQGLTQRDSLNGVADSTLASPFNQIIRNGMGGTWGLNDIRAALGRQFGANRQAPPAAAAAAPATATVAEKKIAETVAIPSKRSIDPQLPLPLRRDDRSAETSRAGDGNDSWSPNDLHRDDPAFSLRSRAIGVGAVALLFVLLVVWAIAHAWNVHDHKPATAAVVSQPAATSAAPTTNPIAPAPTAADVPTTSLPAARDSRANWRVIAFTYNRKTDAEKKASDISHTHPDLQPVVFTPSGHAPFLVSVGGLMDRDAAHALAHRSRSLGLPRDSYAQNYTH